MDDDESYRPFFLSAKVIARRAVPMLRDARNEAIPRECSANVV